MACNPPGVSGPELVPAVKKNLAIGRGAPPFASFDAIQRRWGSPRGCGCQVG
jgi:hypothetical protein